VVDRLVRLELAHADADQVADGDDLDRCEREHHTDRHQVAGGVAIAEQVCGRRRQCDCDADVDARQWLGDVGDAHCDADVLSRGNAVNNAVDHSHPLAYRFLALALAILGAVANHEPWRSNRFDFWVYLLDFGLLRGTILERIH
jgi:hypothetical protein